MNGVDKFIMQEVEYFKPMLERELRSSTEQKNTWKTETIRQRQERISLEVYSLLGGEVTYGPFRGLKLGLDTWWGKLDLGSQCLGLYEKEILNYIESSEGYSAFIDIGAADGYYAVGMLLAKKVPQAICFEQSEHGRITIQRNWEKNGKPGNLSIYGEANEESIKILTSSGFLKNPLVLIDIEGYEFTLLTREVFSALRSATIIIEIHNWVDDFIAKYEKLLTDASEWFGVEILASVPRDTTDIEILRDFTDDNRLLLLSERRPCVMRFLVLKPKTR